MCNAPKRKQTLIWLTLFSTLEQIYEENGERQGKNSIVQECFPTESNQVDTTRGTLAQW